ncbi:hypothetical protein [Paracoccus endophyticus]|uniref:hypothetical protein n=1 Tax=Paracoccus endophyticus TaxID=2233774 RepID=UPI000DD9E88A|nr:hypothetical protein [Paracoccus endophyticus]
MSAAVGWLPAAEARARRSDTALLRFLLTARLAEPERWEIGERHRLGALYDAYRRWWDRAGGDPEEALTMREFSRKIGGWRGRRYGLAPQRGRRSGGGFVVRWHAPPPPLAVVR